MPSQKEILQALYTIKQMCDEADDCDDCPAYNENTDGGACLIRVRDYPANWKLEDIPTITTWRAFK